MVWSALDGSTDTECVYAAGIPFLLIQVCMSLIGRQQCMRCLILIAKANSMYIGIDKEETRRQEAGSRKQEAHK